MLRRNGFRVFFFGDEGWEPPHVHVERGGGVAKYWLKPVTMSQRGSGRWRNRGTPRGAYLG